MVTDGCYARDILCYVSDTLKNNEALNQTHHIRAALSVFPR